MSLEPTICIHIRFRTMHLQITRAHASPAHRRASRLRIAALAPPLDLPTCRGCDGPHGPTHPPQNHNRQLLANPVPFLWCDALLQLDIYGPLTTSSCSPYGYPPAWLRPMYYATAPSSAHLIVNIVSERRTCTHRAFLLGGPTPRAVPVCAAHAHRGRPPILGSRSVLNSGSPVASRCASRPL